MFRNIMSTQGSAKESEAVLGDTAKLHTDTVDINDTLSRDQKVLEILFGFIFYCSS